MAAIEGSKPRCALPVLRSLEHLRKRPDIRPRISPDQIVEPDEAKSARRERKRFALLAVPIQCGAGESFNRFVALL